MPMPMHDFHAEMTRLPYNKNIDLRNLDGLETETDLPAGRQGMGDLQLIHTPPELHITVKELVKAVAHATPCYQRVVQKLLKYLRAKPSGCLVYGREQAKQKTLFRLWHLSEAKPRCSKRTHLSECRSQPVRNRGAQTSSAAKSTGLLLCTRTTTRCRIRPQPGNHPWHVTHRPPLALRPTAAARRRH
jgi:hypothetical protein